MVQVVKITGEKRKALPAPKWLSHPVSGKEAQKQAKEYEEQMEQIANGHDVPKS